jgi:hypothetical protein
MEPLIRSVHTATLPSAVLSGKRICSGWRLPIYAILNGWPVSTKANKGVRRGRSVSRHHEKSSRPGASARCCYRGRSRKYHAQTPVRRGVGHGLLQISLRDHSFAEFVSCSMIPVALRPSAVAVRSPVAGGLSRQVVKRHGTRRRAAVPEDTRRASAVRRARGLNADLRQVAVERFMESP